MVTVKSSDHRRPQIHTDRAAALANRHDLTFDEREASAVRRASRRVIRASFFIIRITPQAKFCCACRALGGQQTGSEVLIARPGRDPDMPTGNQGVLHGRF
jgi:hypothetical protein